MFRAGRAHDAGRGPPPPRRLPGTPLWLASAFGPVVPSITMSFPRKRESPLGGATGGDAGGAWGSLGGLKRNRDSRFRGNDTVGKEGGWSGAKGMTLWAKGNGATRK
jgi:hypothetical protein